MRISAPTAAGERHRSSRLVRGITGGAKISVFPDIDTLIPIRVDEFEQPRQTVYGTCFLPIEIAVPVLVHLGKGGAALHSMLAAPINGAAAAKTSAPNQCPRVFMVTSFNNGWIHGP